MRFSLVVFGLACLHTLANGQTPSGLSVAVEWKYLDWTYPSVQLTGKPFIFNNSFTQDVDLDEAGRIFVTSPQWLDGVPITLSSVTEAEGPGGPLLTPYPDWTWHTPNDCNKLVSVYRMAIDECNRMWVVDIGKTGVGTRSEATNCPMKIMIFDLYKDQLIHKYIIPRDQTVNGEASYVTPIVEVGETCLDSFLYVSDVLKYGILVYDLRNDRSWRLNNTPGNAFGPDPDPEAMNITIAGEWFDLTDGTLGMSLSPPRFFKHRYLYFNSLASFYQKFTSVDSLKESEFRPPLIFQSRFKRSSQAGVQATSRRGVIFFGLPETTAIACWNIERPFTPENIAIIAQDEVALQYVSGIKVKINHRGQEELWFNTNRLQKTINKTLRPTEVNFRLIRGLVNEIIKNTVCEPIGVGSLYPEISTWRQI